MVSAGLVRSRLSFCRESSISVCFSRYSASTARSGLMITTPESPSTIRSSLSRMSARALCVAVAEESARVVRGDCGADVEAARDDGVVRRHAADVREERAVMVGLELDHV